MVKFIFDLDGTITSEETLPIISKHFGIEKDIKDLTEKTVQGNIPFIESFIKRVHILGKLSVSEISLLLEKVNIYPELLKFIESNSENCVIATGNLYPWIDKLAAKIGCKLFSSEAILENDRVVKINKILKKEDVVQYYKDLGEEVVFIGDGNNDMEAMRIADIAIANGSTHFPAKSVLSVADYLVFDEKKLVQQLEQIKELKNGKSIVLTCAGVGSRLGLGKTKVLIEFSGKPLINWHLENFSKCEDIRIVVGFEAEEVIKTVLEFTKNIIFVYNHNYFNTKTGASFYAGAKHGREYAIQYDGDLIVNPLDVQKFLNEKEEFVAGSKMLSEEGVFLNINEDNCVISFSREEGDYEWTGPACLRRDRVKFQSNNVFNQLEPYLPLKFLEIEAQDIDTYADYNNAIKLMEKFENELKR